MRSHEDVREVLELIERGLNNCEIARQTGVPRTTVRDWRSGQVPRAWVCATPAGACERCGHCEHDFESFDAPAYAYLLGMYLGDGYIVANRRGVYRLSICLDAAYPGIIEEVAEAVLSFIPSRHVSVQRFPNGSRGRVC
jgi:hypothetical protein